MKESSDHALPTGRIPLDHRSDWAGPNLLATIVFENYGQHQPLNRQRERYAHEGVALKLSRPAGLARRVAAHAGARAIALKLENRLSVTAYMEPFRVRPNGATRCSG